MNDQNRPGVEKVYERLGRNPIARHGIRPGGLKLTQRLLNLANFSRGARILDAGCGSGATLEYMRQMHPDLQAFGVDRSSELLKLARTDHYLDDIVNADIGFLPLRESSFDGVVSECCLSIISYSRVFLDELFRVLKPDGKLLLTDVYLRNDSGPESHGEFVQGCCLSGATGRSEIVSRLAVCGFRIINWEDHSQSLKDFAVRWILENGSMKEFWRLMSNGQTATSCLSDWIQESRPGYYLMVAQKNISGTN